jgi:two-component system phosphate regulon sensor histidine kinase PhoR
MTDLWLAGWLITLALLAWCGFRLRQLRRDRDLAAQACAAAIADRTVTRQQTSEIQARLESIGAAEADGLLLLDADRRILWGNPTAWALFGREAPLVNQPFIVLASDAELNQAVQDSLAGGRPVARQAAVEGRILRINVAPVVTVGGAAAVISDVTELQRLGRARRDLVANISHELRTPLANIALAAETLRGAEMTDEVRGRLLDQIESQVRALSQLSQEMLDLAQIESGQVVLRLTPTAVADMVEQAVAQLAPQAAAKGQRLSVKAPAGLMALADVEQATRVIVNLLHNAVKFTPVGGSIRLEAEPAGEDVLLRVSDSGPGVPPAERSRIFERFYKADRARANGGTGLGLAIARHIVEGHGGRIWVEGAAGGGAQFCFTLPRA